MWAMIAIIKKVLLTHLQLYDLEINEKKIGSRSEMLRGNVYMFTFAKWLL